MKDDKLVCNFCDRKIEIGSDYIWPKSKHMLKKKYMCVSCIQTIHKGNKMAAQQWIEKTFGQLKLEDN